MTIEIGVNRCAGACFLSFAEIVREQHGAAAWGRIEAALDAELREALQHGAIVERGWYPLNWYRHLHTVAQQTLGQDVVLAATVGRLSIRRDMTTGASRLLVKVLSPQTIIAKAAHVFGSYYEGGRVSILEKNGSRVRVRWTHCADFDRNIWADVFGGCVGALEAAGARHVVTSPIDGGGDEDEQAVVDLTWD
jgi:hypothetical protein